jgi:hypothetical protein
MRDLRSHRPERHGIALLLVLAIVIMVVCMLGSAAARRSMSRLEHARAADLAMADELLEASVAPIEAFLADESADVILPPETLVAEVIILDDALGSESRPIHLTIAAFDLCAAIPLDRLHPGSPLRSALPSELLEGVDALLDIEASRPGLDLLAGDPRLEAFPVVPGGPPALAHFLRPLPSPSPRINVCTAPRSVLETVLRELGRGGLDAILSARAHGKRPVLPREAGHSARSRARLGLATTSESWAFRIDVASGGIRRSWWATYEHTSSGWKLTQRSLIT